MKTTQTTRTVQSDERGLFIVHDGRKLRPKVQGYVEQTEAKVGDVVPISVRGLGVTIHSGRRYETWRQPT